MEINNANWEVYYGNEKEGEEILNAISQRDVDIILDLDEKSHLHSSMYLLSVTTDIAKKKGFKMPKLSIIVNGIEQILGTAASYPNDIKAIKKFVKDSY